MGIVEPVFLLVAYCSRCPSVVVGSMLTTYGRDVGYPKKSTSILVVCVPSGGTSDLWCVVMGFVKGPSS